MEQTLELGGIYKRIWELAQPYLDTRKNDTHTAIATAFAFRLLEMEGGDEDIVIPAILLHDVGWKKVPEDVQLKAFGPHADQPQWNRAALESEISRNVQKTIKLTKPVPVYFTYLTAWVDNGIVHFRNDLYNRDASAFDGGEDVSARSFSSSLAP